MNISDRDPGDEQQMSLEQLWPCPSCQGSTRQPLTGDPCRVCQASGTVAYDPDDLSEVPF